MSTRANAKVNLLLVLGASSLLMASGCAARATAEDCERACGNLRGVFLEAVQQETNRDDTLKKLGATGAQLAQETASLFIDYFTRDCVKECESRATSKTADCLAGAKSEEDVKKCFE